MNKKLIIVLGTGRCGTKSIVSVLNNQPGFRITHELRRLKWMVNISDLKTSINMMMDRECVYTGDAAFWYLNYVPFIKDEYPNTFFICLRRDRDETVDSYMRKTPIINHWTSQESEHYKEAEWNIYWSPCYPHYDLTKKEAIYLFWDKYYEKAARFEKEICNFRIVEMNDVLNTEDNQAELIHWLGVPYADVRLLINCRLNKGRTND